MKKQITTVLVLALFSGHLSAQIINTVAGTGTASSTGDGGVAVSATINNPAGAYRDASGNIYVAEYTGQKIRKINTSGVVSLFAGTGAIGSGGDGGPATLAQFHYPIDIVDDPAGNVYIVDNTNHKIRKVNAAGIISTFAGTGAVGYTGDGGPATAATLHNPNRLTIDAAGNIFIADAVNHAIRKVNTAGIISTVAGIGTAGFSGDGGPATAAQLSTPLGVAFDANGNMYIADGGNKRIRKVSPTGIITTFAGTGASGTSGDGSPATAATMMYPNGVAVDHSCNIYFSDWTAHTVRKINGSGIISTVVGTPATAGFFGDGGLASLAKLNGPDNLTFDAGGNLYIPDFYNNRIRMVANLGETTPCPSIVPVASFSSSAILICEDSCATFTSTSTGSIDSIRWVTVPTGPSISSGTSISSTICFPNPGSFVVRLKVYGGSNVDSSSVTITVNPAPHPVITKIGHTFTVTGGPYTSYQWYNSGPIAGATSATYTYVTDAVYSVVVDSAGCKGVSNTINTAGITDLYEGGQFWALYNSNSIVLRSLQPIIEPVAISIFDITGRKLLQETWTIGTDTKDVNNCTTLPSGLYIVRLYNENNIKSLKVFKP